MIFEKCYFLDFKFYFEGLEIFEYSGLGSGAIISLHKRNIFIPVGCRAFQICSKDFEGHIISEGIRILNFHQDGEGVFLDLEK